MLDLGTVRPGTTLYIPFATYDSNDPSTSVTLTGLAASDIEIYKDGSTTQRASDNGYTLLDTDGIDFDAVTGIHGFSINLADNSTAGFYASGSQYWVVVASITVDGATTVNFIAATFRIGYPEAVLNTTIATLASQTSFTLTSGPAEDDALNGCPVVVHDVASAVQMCVGFVSDYTGSTKTVTLAADPAIFTMAATDNISIFLPANVRAVAGLVTNGTNLGSACANYSATRGLTGTAVPAAAADAAGGLVISDAGGLDADAQRSDVAAILVDTGTTLDGRIPAALVGGRMDANMGAISTDATAADNLEAAYDGNGYAHTGNTYPWTAAWDAEVQSEVNDGLVAYGASTLTAAQANAEVVDVVGTDTLVAGVTIKEALRRIGAITSGKVTGAGSGSETFRDFEESASTIVITVDSSGNRSAITYN